MAEQEPGPPPRVIDGSGFTSLPERLSRRRNETPDRAAYVFLADGDEEQSRLSFAELEARALAIAAALIRGRLAGERALLLYSPGLDFVAAFFGCLYAGTIAVPAYPPAPSTFGKSLPRLRA